MGHFTAGCPYPHDQCKCYTARSWSPGSERPEDARCVNCNQSHGPAVGGSESRVAPGQPADGERSAPPADLDWMEAVPDRLVADIYADLGLLLNIDGHDDKASDWLTDIVSTVLRHVGRELLDRDAAHETVFEGLRQHVGRLTRERDEWEANEQEQYREVQRLDAENNRLRRDIAELAAIEAARYAEVKRLQAELDRLRSALREAFPAWFEALDQAADHTVDRYLTATAMRPTEPQHNGREDQS